MKNYILILALMPLTVLAQYQPRVKGELAEYTYYSLDYNEKHEQANWVYYKLTPEMVKGTIPRKDSFKSDPNISTDSATPDDYEYSGKDQGHLAPAADMKINQIAMQESFYMTNMSPQEGSFNRGRWRSCEAVVRYWGSQETIYICTAGILSEIKGSIGTNKVSVPKYYYKVIYAPESNRMIGFIMENKKLTGNVASYAVSVNEVEQRTGIDFFYQLDDATEDKLESSLDISSWEFKAHKASSNNSSQDASEQCNGVTKSGSRCKRKTNNTNGYCHQHQGQAK